MQLKIRPRIIANFFLDGAKIIFAALAEFERQLIQERTQAGLRAAEPEDA